jgi:hypothetical protein
MLVVFLVATAVFARSDSGKPPIFLWCVTGPEQHRIDLRGTPIQNSAVIFYEHEFGVIPRFWKGKPERGGVPQAVDMNAHLARLRIDIEKKVPDPNWAGYAIIDLEAWGPLWEHANEEYRQLSTSIARRNHPQRPDAEITRIARANYELGARSLLEKTLAECKRLRPRTKWGFYNWPHDDAQPEKLDWLWRSITAFYPVCYTIHKTAPDGRSGDGYAPAAHYLARVKATVEGARRVAGPDRPVIALVWVRYHDMNPVFGNQFLDQPDLERMLQAPLDDGADGLAFWDAIGTKELADQYREYLRKSLVPALRSLR